MRYLLTILILSLNALVHGQYSIHFETGDHLYYFESIFDAPTHYQVCPYDSQCVGFIKELGENGVQECILAFDPITEFIYPEYHSFNKRDSIYIIPTPYLRKATRFEVNSKHRIFLILKTVKKEI